MAKNIKGSHVISIDGEHVALRLTMNNRIRFKELRGFSVLQAFQNLDAEGEENFDPDEALLRDLFWAAMGFAGTVEEAGEAIEAIGLLNAFEAIGAAYAASMPDAPEDDGAGSEGEEPAGNQAKAG